MKNKKYLIAAAATLLLVGCNADKSSVQDFFPADEGRAIDNFRNAQAAAGARADATLQPMHFDGAKLNSLGEAKLDLMLKDDDSAESIVVYMNLDSEDTDLRGRRDAVTSYLEDRGMDKDHIELKLGSNPKTTSLTAGHIANMKKTETGGEDSKSSGGAPGGSAEQSK